MAFDNPLPLSLQRDPLHDDGSTDAFVKKYEDIWSGIFEWEGIPDDSSSGYINRCLFHHEGVGVVDVKGFGKMVLPGSPRQLSYNDNPVSWTPNALKGRSATLPDGSPMSFPESRSPYLSLGMPILRKIGRYLAGMIDAYDTLDTNLLVMQTPMGVSGVSGNEADMYYVATALSNRKRIIPKFSEGFPAQAIDLGARDHTQSTISVINFYEGQIMGAMGITNTGVEKKSGINEIEALITAQPVNVSIAQYLNVMQKWAERTNDLMGTELSVSLGDEYYEFSPHESVGIDERDDYDDEDLP